jgi:hypothetical protein
MMDKKPLFETLFMWGVALVSLVTGIVTGVAIERAFGGHFDLTLGYILLVITYALLGFVVYLEWRLR